MQLRYYLELVAQRAIDYCFMVLPRRRPRLQPVIDCKLISHRGEHDNVGVRENTMAAFTAVATAGVWGIELDVRWTRDLQPVVIHDADTGRVFDVELEVAQVSLHELRQRLPDIPTLSEVVESFGGRVHLMVELKPGEPGALETRNARLREIFASLRPAVDYHFLALQSSLFEMVTFAGNKACLPVAELNLDHLSRAVLDSDFAGICGQYLLLNKTIIGRHHQRGQRLGSGFAASRFCFYRELNRGVDWIFTNHALKLNAIRQQLLRR